VCYAFRPTRTSAIRVALVVSRTGASTNSIRYLAVSSRSTRVLRAQVHASVTLTGHGGATTVLVDHTLIPATGPGKGVANEVPLAGTDRLIVPLGAVCVRSAGVRVADASYAGNEGITISAFGTGTNGLLIPDNTVCLHPADIRKGTAVHTVVVRTYILRVGTVCVCNTLQFSAVGERVSFVSGRTGTNRPVPSRLTDGVEATRAARTVVQDRGWGGVGYFLAAIAERPQFKAAFTRATRLVVDCAAPLVASTDVCPTNHFTLEVPVAALVFRAVVVTFALPRTTLGGVGIGDEVGHTAALSRGAVPLGTHRVGPTWVREARITTGCSSRNYIRDTWSSNRGGWSGGPG